MSRSMRHSHMRVARRRALWRVERPNLVPCPRCKEPVLPYRVCPRCGFYNGRAVIPEAKPSRT
jgi:large subunit ribosomal protein L32